MQHLPNSLSLPADHLTAYEAQVHLIEDARPHPPEAALDQLGGGLMTELLDMVCETALEDFHVLIGEALIGAFHSAAQRIERDADKARGHLAGLVRDFDGSEVLDVEIQEATRKVQAADVAALAMEIVRDAAASSYAAATGQVWSPWKGSVKASRATAAQIEARDAIRAAKTRNRVSADAGSTVVAFRGAPPADTAEDAGRIFDALNWALAQWPDMALATSGAKGAEKLAIKWAKQKRVTVVLAKADFGRHGRAAPFRANDEMLELDPVCVLTLANSINAQRALGLQPFGPALNLAQKATEKGLRHFPVKARACKPVRAVELASLFVRRQRQDQVAVRLVPLAAQAQKGLHQRGVGVLHVLGATPVKISVLLDKLKWIGGPVRAESLHHVHMAKKEDRLLCGRACRAETHNEILLAFIGAQQANVLGRKSRIEEAALHRCSCSGHIALGRVGGVGFDEFFKDFPRQSAIGRGGLGHIVLRLCERANPDGHEQGHEQGSENGYESIHGIPASFIHCRLSVSVDARRAAAKNHPSEPKGHDQDRGRGRSNRPWGAPNPEST